MSPLGPVLGACSPECVEGVSLLKNPSVPPPRSIRGLNARLLQRLSRVSEAFGHHCGL